MVDIPWNQTKSNRNPTTLIITLRGFHEWHRDVVMRWLTRRWLIIVLFTIYTFLNCWVSPKFSGVKDKIKSSHNEKKKSQTCGHRKIPLTLFQRFNLPLDRSQKLRREINFLIRWRICLITCLFSPFKIAIGTLLSWALGPSYS